MQDCIAAIIKHEWDFFQMVQNVGGRACCQDNYATFEIMRKSQLLAWNENVCASYKQDLIAAKESGRNLLAEKYTHMMQRTAPGEYARLKTLLPAVSEDAAALVEAIVAIQLQWQQAYAREYPRLVSRSRPVGSSGDMPTDTSFETYLRGELLTYSAETLKLYADHVVRLHAEGVNMNARIMEHTVKMYGYASLEEAEASIVQ